jgi:hypothetical protein
MIFDRVKDTRAFMKHLDKLGLKSTIKILGGNVNEVHIGITEDGDQHVKFVQRNKTILETVLPKRDSFKESV